MGSIEVCEAAVGYVCRGTGVQSVRDRDPLMASIGVLKSACVYTPKTVATAMVDAVRRMVDGLWLEPCVGDGAFLRALHEAGIERHSIVGLDLAVDRTTADRFATVTRGADFISWARKESRRFSAVIGNPPYLTVERLPKRLRERARKVNLPDGTTLPRGANYWLAFLYAAAGLLQDGGTMAFLLPAAHEYADYARHWRKWVASHFERTHVYRVSRRVFDDVQEGSIVLIASGYRRPTMSVEYVQCDSAVELIVALQNLDKTEPKPTKTRGVLSAQTPLLCWDDVFDMRVGVVTGHNESFVLTEEQRRHARLPRSAVVPIVGRARQIALPEVTASHWNKLKREGIEVWLFRPSSEARRSRHVAAYIKSIEPAKKYFKVTERAHWERPDVPHIPQGFLTGMSMHGPWIALSRKRGLLATNTLYTVRFKTAQSIADRATIALGLLTSIVRDQLRSVQRIYPDGLPKLEPRDLRQLTLPVRRGDGSSLTTYKAALNALLGGDEHRAREIADAWFAKRY
jgi:adenine-specific DNA-methyltransferase